MIVTAGCCTLFACCDPFLTVQVDVANLDKRTNRFFVAVLGFFFGIFSRREFKPVWEVKSMLLIRFG